MVAVAFTGALLLKTLKNTPRLITTMRFGVGAIAQGKRILKLSWVQRSRTRALCAIAKRLLVVNN